MGEQTVGESFTRVAEARRGPFEIGDGEARNIPLGDGIHLTVIPDASATATVSRVDGMEVASHDDDSQETVAAQTPTSFNDWPYFRVSSAGGVTRVAIA